MSKIQLHDSLKDILLKMSMGNPGAISAMMEIIHQGEKIDPQCYLGHINPILYLDILQIYGTEIYILWNDQCDRDTRKLIMLLRAVQLGFLQQERLKQIAQDQMRQFLLSEEEITVLDEKVCDFLPDFQKSK